MTDDSVDSQTFRAYVPGVDGAVDVFGRGADEVTSSAFAAKEFHLLVHRAHEVAPRLQKDAEIINFV